MHSLGKEMKKMKKVGIMILSIALMTLVSGCTKEVKPTDFWAATINVLEDKLESNGYNKGNWQIGVEDTSMVEDKAHRSLTIRYVEEDSNPKKTTMFSLQNTNNKKTVAYIYKQSEMEGNKQYDKMVSITSTDDAYKSYDINYTYQEFSNGNYFDGSEANGKLTIKEDQSITYDNVPLLAEAMDNCKILIDKFQEEFKVNYKDYNFITLPELAESIEIAKIDKADQGVARTLDYYSQPTINARGYSLVTFLKINKDFSRLQYCRYSIEQEAFEFNLDLALEKRSIENCYNIVQNDPDISYAVYIHGDVAYMYLQSLSDQEIQNDAMNKNGSQAKSILKTTNKSYP